MVSNRLSISTVIVIFVLLLGFSNFNFVEKTTSTYYYSSAFEDWRPDNQTLIDLSCNSCHTGGNIEGTGLIEILPIGEIFTQQEFNLSISVSGFIQASNENILIGLNDLDNNNSFFTKDGKTQSRNSIQLDSNGDSNPISFPLKAPQEFNNYSLLFYAIYGDSGNVFSFIYKDLNLEVKEVVDDDPPIISDLKINSVNYSEKMEIRGDFFIEISIIDANLGSVSYSVDNLSFYDLDFNESTKKFCKMLNTNKFFDTNLNLSIRAIDLANNVAIVSYKFIINNSGLLPDVDILSYKVSRSLNIADNKIDEIWGNYPTFLVPEFGENGFIQSLHDETYIYALIGYDISLTWISIEFDFNVDLTTFMNINHDSWTFGNGDFDYFGDCYMQGSTTYPEADMRNDIFFNKVENDQMGYIELMRLIETNDTEGKDIVFSHDSSISVVFASNVHHTSEHLKYTWQLTDINPTNLQPPTTDEPTGLILSPKEISDIVFVLSVGIVIVTVFIHGSLRVISKPIKHEKRVIRTDKLPNELSSVELIKNYLFKNKNKENLELDLSEEE